MKSEMRTERAYYFYSEVHPEFETQNSSDADMLTWADNHPRVWDVILSTKSKSFGRHSSAYMGWARDNTSLAVIERLHIFKQHLDGDRSVFFQKSAEFTLEHIDEPRLTGDLVQQWKKGAWRQTEEGEKEYDHNHEFPRSCCYLDYTPETLEEVLDRFETWMDVSSNAPNGAPLGGTTRLMVGAETKRIYPNMPKRTNPRSNAVKRKRT